VYEKALALNPLDYELLGYLAGAQFWVPGKLAESLANYARAAQMVEEHKRVNPRSASILSSLAGYYGILGNRGKALPLIEEMLRLFPEDLHPQGARPSHLER
jgi:tetratricopeptide (TPR) repeat protein